MYKNMYTYFLICMYMSMLIPRVRSAMGRLGVARGRK